jgi:hypothetical protein
MSDEDRIERIADRFEAVRPPEWRALEDELGLTPDDVEAVLDVLRDRITDIIGPDWNDGQAELAYQGRRIQVASMRLRRLDTEPRSRTIGHDDAHRLFARYTELLPQIKVTDVEEMRKVADEMELLNWELEAAVAKGTGEG